MKALFPRIIFQACILILISTSAYAAAWTQSKGSVQTILTADAYESTHSFDKHGKITSSGSAFYKYEFNPFVEYGLRDDLTIGANPSLQHWQIANPNLAQATEFRGCGSSNILSGNQSSGDIIQSEFFIRKRLIESGNAILSVQPLIKTPCVLFNDANASVSWNTYEMELRALAGYGFKWDPALLGSKMRPFSGQYHFADLEVAYRKRAGALSDQIKIDSTLGFRFSANILMLAQAFSVFSTGEENVGNVEIAKNVYRPHIDNYFDTKLQLSGVVQATKTSSVQIGVYGDVMGKNYGAGNGLLISLWKGF